MSTSNALLPPGTAGLPTSPSTERPGTIVSEVASLLPPTTSVVKKSGFVERFQWESLPLALLIKLLIGGLSWVTVAANMSVIQQANRFVTILVSSGCAFLIVALLYVVEVHTMHEHIRATEEKRLKEIEDKRKAEERAKAMQPAQPAPPAAGQPAQPDQRSTNGGAGGGMSDSRSMLSDYESAQTRSMRQIHTQNASFVSTMTGGGMMMMAAADYSATPVQPPTVPTPSPHTSVPSPHASAQYLGGNAAPNGLLSLRRTNSPMSMTTDAVPALAADPPHLSNPRSLALPLAGEVQATSSPNMHTAAALSSPVPARGGSDGDRLLGPASAAGIGLSTARSAPFIDASTLQAAAHTGAPLTGSGTHATGTPRSSASIRGPNGEEVDIPTHESTKDSTRRLTRHGTPVGVAANGMSTISIGTESSLSMRPSGSSVAEPQYLESNFSLLAPPCSPSSGSSVAQILRISSSTSSASVAVGGGHHSPSPPPSVGTPSQPPSLSQLVAPSVTPVSSTSLASGSTMVVVVNGGPAATPPSGTGSSGSGSAFASASSTAHAPGGPSPSGIGQFAGTLGSTRVGSSDSTSSTHALHIIPAGYPVAPPGGGNARAIGSTMSSPALANLISMPTASSTVGMGGSSSEVSSGQPSSSSSSGGGGGGTGQTNPPLSGRKYTLSPGLLLRLPTFLSPIPSSGASAETIRSMSPNGGSEMNVDHPHPPSPLSHTTHSHHRGSSGGGGHPGMSNATPAEIAAVVAAATSAAVTRASVDRGRRASFSSAMSTGSSSSGTSGSNPANGGGEVVVGTPLAAIHVPMGITAGVTVAMSPRAVTPETVPPRPKSSSADAAQSAGAGLVLGPATRHASASETDLQMSRFAREVAAKLSLLASRRADNDSESSSDSSAGESIHGAASATSTAAKSGGGFLDAAALLAGNASGSQNSVMQSAVFEQTLVAEAAAKQGYTSSSEYHHNPHPLLNPSPGSNGDAGGGGAHELPTIPSTDADTDESRVASTLSSSSSLDQPVSSALTRPHTTTPRVSSPHPARASGMHASTGTVAVVRLGSGNISPPRPSAAHYHGSNLQVHAAAAAAAATAGGNALGVADAGRARSSVSIIVRDADGDVVPGSTNGSQSYLPAPEEAGVSVSAGDLRRTGGPASRSVPRGPSSRQRVLDIGSSGDGNDSGSSSGSSSGDEGRPSPPHAAGSQTQPRTQPKRRGRLVSN
ncbi:hypothetical protein H9P43_008709 [Blastocladiella emersonii ATCC 22665]|nr:hypothetical protein H9P43_008709 [Blastocladiella emersonii ATCC 22665]